MIPVADGVMNVIGGVALLCIVAWFGYLFIALVFWVFDVLSRPFKPSQPDKPKRSPPAATPEPAPRPAPVKPKPTPVPTPPKRDRSLRQREFNHLFRRDGGKCGICGQAFDMLNFNPSSIEVDHIKPRAAGGTDDLDNLQLAHARCNQRKGARYIPPNSK